MRSSPPRLAVPLSALRSRCRAHWRGSGTRCSARGYGRRSRPTSTGWSPPPRRTAPPWRASRPGRRVPAERRLATEFAGPDESPGFLLWQVTNRWQQAQRATLKAHDLTHVQFVLLATLSWQAADGPVTQKQLADAA